MSLPPAPDDMILAMQPVGNQMKLDKGLFERFKCRAREDPRMSWHPSHAIGFEDRDMLTTP